MICWILLLIILTSCVSGEVSESQKRISVRVQSDKDALEEGRIKQSSNKTDGSGLYLCKVNAESSGKNDLNYIGQLEVNVAQTYYQAEENHNITLEWTFPTKPYRATNIFIDCFFSSNHNTIRIYHVSGGALSESLDKKFSGRVQSDEDALREGRIRLQLSKLRTDDSGQYRCEVLIDLCKGSASCRLNVTAFHKPDHQTPTVRPQPESKKSSSIVGVGISAVVICGGIICFIFRNTNQQTGNLREERHFVTYYSISAESNSKPTVSSTSV